jgi:sn1-specific diacylglycerol lipase
MPALRLCGRSWLVALDDLVIPAFLLCVLHVVWLCVLLSVYAKARGKELQQRETCGRVGEKAMDWVFVSSSLFFLAASVEFLIGFESSKGKILEPNKRRRARPLLIVHSIILVAIVCAMGYGVVLMNEEGGKECYETEGVKNAVLSVIVGNFVVVGLTAFGVFSMFSAFAHLDPEERWQRIFSILGCLMCVGRGGSSSSSSNGIRRESTAVEDLENIDKKTRERGGVTAGRGGGMSAIADCFGEIFQGADLVPSDISAGLALLAVQDRRMLKDPPKGILLKPSSAAAPIAAASLAVNEGKDVERGDIEVTLLTTSESPRSAASSSLFSDERETSSSSSYDVPIKSSGELLSKTLEDMAHYARWSLAAYGWTLYAWAHPSKGFKMAFSFKGMSRVCCGWYYRRQKRKKNIANGRGSNSNSSNNSSGDVVVEVREDMEEDEEEEKERLYNSRQDVTLDRAALKACAGISSRDIFYISKEEGVGKVPYFIARDVKKRSVVLSIRGTLSIADCVTDAMYKPTELDINLLGKDIAKKKFSGSQLHCHKGIAEVSEFVFNDLNRHRILDQVILGEEGTAEGDSIPEDVLSECRGWRLVLTGHSLGGATASIVALFLREKFPTLKVVAIEPPGGLLGAELAKETEQFCTSSIHGLDSITRLSGPTLLKLRSEVINALVRCKLSKVQLIRKLTMSRTALVESDVFNDDDTDDALPSEATSLRQSFNAFSEQQISSDPNMAAPLYPPGELLYLRKVKYYPTDDASPSSSSSSSHSGNRRRATKTIRHFNYEIWKIEAKDLMDRGFLVGPSFFIDHFPDTVAAVLSGLAASFGEEGGAARDENEEDHQEQRTKLVARMGLPKSVSKEHVASDLDHLVDDDDDD